MKRFLKRGGEEILRHGKKKSPSPAQPSPTEKQKLKSRQPLSPSLLQPGDARGPQKQPQSSESPRRGSRRSCAPTAEQRETRERDSAREDAAALPPRPRPGPPALRPSGDGAQSPSPSKAPSTQFCRGPAPAPALPRGTLPRTHPLLRWSSPRESGGPAPKDDGV